jgi:hypothetical protein
MKVALLTAGEADMSCQSRPLGAEYFTWARNVGVLAGRW